MISAMIRRTPVLNEIPVGPLFFRYRLESGRGQSSGDLTGRRQMVVLYGRPELSVEFVQLRATHKMADGDGSAGRQRSHKVAQRDVDGGDVGEHAEADHRVEDAGSKGHPCGIGADVQGGCGPEFPPVLGEHVFGQVQFYNLPSAPGGIRQHDARSAAHVQDAPAAAGNSSRRELGDPRRGIGRRRQTIPLRRQSVEVITLDDQAHVEIGGRGRARGPARPPRWEQRQLAV